MKTIEELKKECPPYTRKQMDLFELNTFNSPWSDYRRYNGQKFKVLYEHYEDDKREPIGFEYSSAWEDKDGNVISNRYFEIELECGVQIMAEEEELNNWYVETKQI